MKNEIKIFMNYYDNLNVKLLVDKTLKNGKQVRHLFSKKIVINLLKQN